MLYYEDLKFFWAGRRPVIRYNTIHYLTTFFHDLAEAGIPMLSFINLFFMYIGQMIVCVIDWWYGHIILWFGWSSVWQWCTLDVFIFLNISQPGWMKLDPGSSGLQNSFNLHSKYKSIHVKNVLESNMERHRLITSQWCRLLTSTRGITNNDDDPQGTTVQFAWCEKGLGVKHHTKSPDRRPLM